MVFCLFKIGCQGFAGSTATAYGGWAVIGYDVKILDKFHRVFKIVVVVVSVSIKVDAVS